MRKVLITGGAGFIGSNFILHYLKSNPNDTVVNVDKLTYAGDLKNLEGVEKFKNYYFEQIDITDKHAVENVMKKYNISDVIHLAAESHVDNSIEGPGAFIHTNLVGTFNLIESARNLWMNSPHSYKKNYENSRFHHVSTDEVYGTLGETGKFEETTPYAPNSPYSASKAGSDFIVRSYFHTYGMNVVTTNCSNNYGPRQHNEKLIPTIIRKALSNEPIPIYGNGKNIRDWLYVKDHCIALETVFKSGKPGETYNIGGDAEKTNNEIVDFICSSLDQKVPKEVGSYKDQITFVKDRPGHDLRYAIDASKIKNDLNWEPQMSFEEGIEATINFYINKK